MTTKENGLGGALGLTYKQAVRSEHLTDGQLAMLLDQVSRHQVQRVLHGL